MKKRLLMKRKRSKIPKEDSLAKESKMDGNPDGGLRHVYIHTNDPKDIFARSLQSVHPNKYENDKAKLLKKEANESWDRNTRLNATDAERKAGRIIWKIRENERDNLFGNKASEAIPGPGTLDMGGQFLTNWKRVVNESKLYKIAQQLPKGCHLHLHFNAELETDRLIERAKLKENMFIRSTQPLLEPKDFDETEMVFNVLPNDHLTVDIFSPEYNPDWRAPGTNPWMRWRDFMIKFEEVRDGEKPEEWIKGKMVLSEEEVYGFTQTTNGIWARFNQATRCFKGLLNYESIYRWYVEEAIKSMIDDKVMYAELRPMLMDKFIPTDDGLDKLDHEAQMRLITEEVDKMRKKLREEGREDKFPFGLKIIYCAPRSIPKDWMKREIEDCIKLHLKFKKLICGFDLVGAEDRPNHIGFYKDELLAMVDTCKKLGIEIPFMFHAGETLLDTGGSKNPANSNLYDAVLLNAKRIGHGFSLLKHPVLIEEFKKRPICIELCPTSNELLHLCRNIKEHPYPEILATGIPCTVNSDNPSLFNNSVSHEFYQVMVGSYSMNIHGWRQLVLWSIEHSCLDKDEKIRANAILAGEWEEFCRWVIENYGEDFGGDLDDIDI